MSSSEHGSGGATPDESAALPLPPDAAEDGTPAELPETAAVPAAAGATAASPPEPETALPQGVTVLSTSTTAEEVLSEHESSPHTAGTEHTEGPSEHLPEAAHARAPSGGTTQGPVDGWESAEWRRALRVLRLAAGIAVGAAPATLAAAELDGSWPATELSDQAVRDALAVLAGKPASGNEVSRVAPLLMSPPHISSSQALRPLLYATPDGSLKPASPPRHASSATKAGSTAPSPLVPLRFSPAAASQAATGEALEAEEPEGSGAREDRPAKASESATFLVSYLLGYDNVLEQILNVATDSRHYTLCEQADALFTVVYCMQILLLPSCPFAATWLGELSESRGAPNATACAADESGADHDPRGGPNPEDGGASLSRMRVMEITSCACRLLRSALEAALLPGTTPGGAHDAELDDPLSVLHTVINTFYVLLGCVESNHWDEHQLAGTGAVSVVKATADDAAIRGRRRASPNYHCGRGRRKSSIAEPLHLFSADESTSKKRDGLSYARFTPSAGYSGCLCTQPSPVIYQFVMTYLMEDGLWEYLWKDVALPYLPKLTSSSSFPEASDDAATLGVAEALLNLNVEELDAMDASWQHMSVERTVATRFVLKLLAQLLVQNGHCLWVRKRGLHDSSGLGSSVGVGDAGYRSPDSRCARGMETLLWGASTSATAPQRLHFTITKLCEFLQFSRVSCYAANALHVLLAHVYAFPASSLVGERVDVLLRSVFLRDVAAALKDATVPAEATATFADTGAPSESVGDVADEARRKAAAARNVQPPAAMSALCSPLADPLRDVVNSLAFRIEAFQEMQHLASRDEVDHAHGSGKKGTRCVTQWASKRLHASLHNSVVQHSALFMTILLLDQHYTSGSMLKRLQADASDSYRAVLAPILGRASYGQDSPGVTSQPPQKEASWQTLASAGLARTLQVMSLQCSIVEGADPLSPMSVPPRFLRVELDNVVAFATTVTPDAGEKAGEAAAWCYGRIGTSTPASWADTLCLVAHVPHSRSMSQAATSCSVSLVMCCQLKSSLPAVGTGRHAGNFLQANTVTTGPSARAAEGIAQANETDQEHLPGYITTCRKVLALEAESKCTIVEPVAAVSQGAIQVFVRVPLEEHPVEPSGMVFETDQRSFHEKLKKVQAVGRTLPRKKVTQTRFVDTSGLDYALVLADSPLFTMFERDTSYATTTADLVVLAPDGPMPVPRRASNTNACTVIVAGATQMAEEIVLWKKAASDAAGGLDPLTSRDLANCSRAAPASSTALTTNSMLSNGDMASLMSTLPKEERRRLVAASRGRSIAGGDRQDQTMQTAILIGPRHGPALPPPYPEAVVVSYAKKPPRNVSSWHELQLLNAAQPHLSRTSPPRQSPANPAATSTDLATPEAVRPGTDPRFGGGHAGVSLPTSVVYEAPFDLHVSPIDVVDVSNKRRDDEITFLNGRLALLERELEGANCRYHEANNSRSELLQRITDLRLELQLCQEEILVPMKTELQKSRKAVSLKTREVTAAMGVIRALQQENEALKLALASTKQKMEALFTLVTHSFDEESVAVTCEKANGRNGKDTW